MELHSKPGRLFVPSSHTIKVYFADASDKFLLQVEFTYGQIYYFAKNFALPGYLEKW